MSPALTYLDFLALFVVLPLSLLTVASAVRYRPDRASRRVQVGGVALMVALALVYTTPWDNYLIARGVWFYGEGTVFMRIGEMPLGEYLFVVFQSVMVGVWTFALDGRVDPTIGHSWRDRLLGGLAGLAVGAVGVAFLLGPPETLYLGAIFTWAAPVFALQWAVGWRYLVAVRRRVAAMLAVPVVYLSTIDRYAIEQGLWTISPEYSTGLTVAGLPVEEGAFFLCTSLFVVQALVLLRWVIARWG
ncbi:MULTISPECIES: lycopene cyclase domain-containing protein [Salinibaculum]|uniref:lycopene cyclase domain-containing protein n=1 Tax=Salinibaculum TaxID=2732368 RepID=UPI0030D2413A